MANQGLTKTFTSAVAIDPYTIVMHDGADTAVAAATASTDPLIGVTTEIASSAGGECDVVVDDIAFVKLGGTVTRGDFITSDSSGHGVAAAPATGVNARVVGMAMQSGVAGDVINMLIAPTQIQG